MNTTKAVLMTTIVAGLRLILTAQVAEVDTKSLPAAVQQTINEQASGGEIVEVKREDEP